MLTTIIYRSHVRDALSFLEMEDMVNQANLKNTQSEVTGILLFNGVHFFQLLEGPDEHVTRIYQDICADPRHYNLVEVMRDSAPERRFGTTGMELFDLRAYDSLEVLQAVLDKSTTRFQLFYGDRALQFFRTFIESRETGNYFEIPSADYWSFCPDTRLPGRSVTVPESAYRCSFAFQPIIDPMSKEIISLEALLRTSDGKGPDAYFRDIESDKMHQFDLESKKVAFEMASALGISRQVLSINLLPMTLVECPNAVSYLLAAIRDNGLVPEQIVVEFTEQEVISRIDKFTRAVSLLKAAGMRVAIDHFGAGFAGLSLLAHFQPDRIKINRDLICDVHKSGPKQAIVQAIIQCCASLEISISAVGVEKPEEWMWLESAGIVHFQGFLFARPVNAGMPVIAWPERKSIL